MTQSQCLYIWKTIVNCDIMPGKEIRKEQAREESLEAKFETGRYEVYVMFLKEYPKSDTVSAWGAMDKPMFTTTYHLTDKLSPHPTNIIRITSMPMEHIPHPNPEGTTKDVIFVDMRIVGGSRSEPTYYTIMATACERTDKLLEKIFSDAKKPSENPASALHNLLEYHIGTTIEYFSENKPTEASEIRILKALQKIKRDLRETLLANEELKCNWAPLLRGRNQEQETEQPQNTPAHTPGTKFSW